MQPTGPSINHACMCVVISQVFPKDLSMMQPFVINIIMFNMYAYVCTCVCIYVCMYACVGHPLYTHTLIHPPTHPQGGTPNQYIFNKSRTNQGNSILFQNCWPLNTSALI